METRHRVLDFTPLRRECTPTFMCLPREEEQRLASTPLTLDRLQSALHFANLLRCAKQEHEMMRAGAYFRASLAEFVSVQEIARVEASNWKKFELLDTTLPLPHMLKLLRNMQIHVRTVSLKDRRMWLHLRLAVGARPVETSKWCVDDLTPEQLLELRAFKINKPQYNQEQATQLVTWFQDAQELFGVPDLVWYAVNDAARRLST